MEEREFTDNNHQRSYKGIRAGTSDESSCQSRCHRASASRRPRRPPLPASRSIRGEETTEAEGPGACKRSRQTWRPIDVRVYGLRNWCAGRPLEQMNNGGAVLVAVPLVVAPAGV